MFNILLYVWIIFNPNMYSNNMEMSYSFDTIGVDYYNNISESIPTYLRSLYIMNY